MKQIILFAVPVLWLISFFFSMPLVEPYEMSRLIALAAGVAALGIILTDPAHRAAFMNVTTLTVLVIGFLIWCGLTFFWSLSPFVTIIAWGTLCLLPLWFLIFTLMPVTHDQIMLTLRLIVGASFVLALWALVQYFLLPQYLNQYGTIHYPFADPNNYAALLNIGLFVALGLLFHGDKRGGKFLHTIICMTLMAALILIGSRMATIAAVAGLVAFALLMRRNSGFHIRIIIILFVTGAAALALSSLFEAERITSLARAAGLLAGFEDPSVSTRLMIWSSTWGMIGNYVWGGSGLGTFFLMYPAARDPAEIYSSGLMAHADPLQFWAEAGLPAIILLYAILIAVLAGFIKFIRTAASDDRARILPVALFCALLTLTLHMHVSFHLFVAPLLTMTGVILGILIRLMPPGKILFTCKVNTPAMTALMLLCGFLVVFQSCLFSEMHTREGVALMNRNDMQGFGDKINQASHEGFGLNPRPYILAASIPLGILQTSPRMAPEERQKLFEQTENLLDQGLAVSPVNAGAYFTKALLYGAMGRGDEAVSFLEETLKIDPQHPQAKGMLGR